MEQLKTIKEQLIGAVQGQMGDLSKVDAKELGEVIDMIKDIAEACYYCSVTEAMDDAKENQEKRSTYYYMEKYLPYYPYGERDEEYHHGRMYYGSRSSSGGNSTESESRNRSYFEEPYPMAWRDELEGKSGLRRRMYMESKATHQDQSKKDSGIRKLYERINF